MYWDSYISYIILYDIIVLDIVTKYNRLKIALKTVQSQHRAEHHLKLSSYSGLIIGELLGGLVLRTSSFCLRVVSDCSHSHAEEHISA
jgi:hypothetical protein